MAGEYEQERGAGPVASALRSVRQHPYTGLLVNIAPSAVWLGVFFLVPLAVMLLYSFGDRGAFGQVLITPDHLGLQQYATFFVPDGMSVTGAAWVTLAWVVERVVPFELGLAEATPTPYVLTLNAKVNAEITNYVYYATPNEAAKEFVDEAALNNESIYPSEETMENLEFIRNLGDATQMWSEAWTEIQNA